MEGAESATEVTSPPAGVGIEHEEEVIHESGTSGEAQVGPQQGSSVSVAPAGSEEETTVVEQETTHVVSSEEGSPGNVKTSALRAEKTEAPVRSSASGSSLPDLHVNESHPAASEGVEVACDAGVGGKALASGGVAGANTLTSSLPYLPTAAPAAFPLTSTGAFYTSPVEGANYEGAGRVPAGERVAGVREGHESGLVEKSLPTFLPKRHEERSLPLSPLSTEREDDIIEFVVQKPTTGGTAVPGFVVTKEGLYSASSCPPPNRDGGFTQPAAYFDMERSQQQQLLRKQQQEEELLHDRQQNLYTSLTPGAFVFVPATKGEEGKGAELASFRGENIHTFSSFVPSPLPPHNEAAPRSFRPPGLSSSPYLMLGAQTTEKGGKMDVAPFVTAAQTLPVGTHWQVPPQTSFGAEVITVPVIPCREPLPPPLSATRKTVPGDKVVVPNAKRLLCFGHAGDEIKFCFGLLQLPPPAIKYDFLLEKKKMCFGLCETTGYVAVCRKCRMRLPTCPFCHKQSAIRHP